MWRLPLGPHHRALAVVTDRSLSPQTLQRHPRWEHRLAWAEQVHGAGVAALEAAAPPARPVSGCDALMTQVPGLALAIRTADCLPVFLWDPVQDVVGLAHAGWRGLAQHLPMRLVIMARQRYHCRAEDLWLGIGPAIRACCYEVRPDFSPIFSSHLRSGASGRVTCDLVGYAIGDAIEAGVSPARVIDCGQCTACEPERWHSVRRDGQGAGRLVSVVMIPSTTKAVP